MNESSQQMPDKIADQLERFANWLDKLANKLGAWRAAERDRRNARRESEERKKSQK